MIDSHHQAKFLVTKLSFDVHFQGHKCFAPKDAVHLVYTNIAFYVSHYTLLLSLAHYSSPVTVRTVLLVVNDVTVFLPICTNALQLLQGALSEMYQNFAFIFRTKFDVLFTLNGSVDVILQCVCYWNNYCRLFIC